MTKELKLKAEEYFKSICEDYNEELERTGKRHYWVGFDIKDAYIAGATETTKELQKEYSDNLSLKDEELMCLETEFNTYRAEAKEIIKTFCGLYSVFNLSNGSFDNLIKKAEAFLNKE